MIQTGNFLSWSSAADILTKDDSDTIWQQQSGKHPLWQDIRVISTWFNNKEKEDFVKGKFQMI